MVLELTVLNLVPFFTGFAPDSLRNRWMIFYCPHQKRAVEIEIPGVKIGGILKKGHEMVNSDFFIFFGGHL